MTEHAAPPISWEPDEPFRHVGGAPGPDLVNTVNWTPRGLERDRLSDYDRLLEWAVGAGVIPRAGAARLGRLAAGRPAEARRACERARLLRDVLQRLFAAVAADLPLDEPLRRLEPWARDAFDGARLAPAGAAGRREGRAVRRSWPAEEERLDGLLGAVVRDAVELLASPDAARVRVCDGDDCGWTYVDRSRNGLRRWCEMETCGTHAKSRRRAVRRGAP